MLEAMEVTTMHCPLCNRSMIEKNHQLNHQERSVLNDNILVCGGCGLEGHQALIKLPEAAARLAAEHRRRLEKAAEEGRQAVAILKMLDSLTSSASPEMA